jgi:hypothetical protein
MHVVLCTLYSDILHDEKKGQRKGKQVVLLLRMGKAELKKTTAKNVRASSSLFPLFPLFLVPLFFTSHLISSPFYYPPSFLVLLYIPIFSSPSLSFILYMHFGISFYIS